MEKNKIIWVGRNFEEIREFLVLKKNYLSNFEDLIDFIQ